MSTIQIGLQLLISIIPWFIGAAIGGGLGYLLARRLRKSINEKPNRRRLFLLVPWRSLIVTLPFLGFFIPQLIGLGLFTGTVIVGAYVLLFSTPFTTTTFLNSWFPLPLRIRLVGLGRIVGVGAISVAAATGLIGGFTASAGMLQALKELNYSHFFSVFFMVFVIAMLIDILFGAVQYVFYRPSDISG